MDDIPRNTLEKLEMCEQGLGVPHSGSGSQASPEAATASSPSVSIPNAGDWIVYFDWSHRVAKVRSVTPKLIKLDNTWLRQIRKDQLVVTAPDRDAAERLKMSFDGVEDEYRRRCQAAHNEARLRTDAAREAADKQIARLIASVIEARSDETAKQAQPEGRERGGEAETPND